MTRRPSRLNWVRPLRPGRTGGDGFTFFELVVVIAIIGILFSIGAISFRGLMPKYRLRTAARYIGTTIEQVRLGAVQRGTWMGIHYVLTPTDTDTKPYYQIIPAAPEDCPDQPIEQRQFLSKQYLDARIARVIVAGNRAIESGAINVLFSPMGNSGSHIVVLEGPDGGSISVKLSSITGTIEFLENAEASFQHFEG